MKSLSFKARYIEDIVAGKKTTTMRRVGAPSNPAVGELVQFRNGRYRPPFAVARITRSSVLDLRDITDRQAKRDGYATADELRATLRQTYEPTLRRVAVIGFRVVEVLT